MICSKPEDSCDSILCTCAYDKMTQILSMKATPYLFGRDCYFKRA